ncbi:MAG: RNA polymerase ECF-type sigma factor [Gemmatimonadota bacterium]
MLWRIAGIYAGDAAAREDLYQEILVALWKALPTFRGESSIRTFISRVGHNRGATHRLVATRRWRREAPLIPGGPGSSEPARGTSPLAYAEAKDRGARLRAAVATLPEPLAQVTSLRLEGFSAKEIGTILGLSTNNVEVRLHRSRKQLRSILSPEDFQ